MSKLLPAQKQYNKIISQFLFLLDNDKLKSLYDTKSRLSCYMILVLVEQLGKHEAIALLKNNKEEFINVLSLLEKDENISKALDEFRANPNITIDEINAKKSLFNSFSNQFTNLLIKLNVDIGEDISLAKEFVETGLIYILYSLIGYKIEKDIDDILNDPEYENKLKIIINNTRLFSNFRQLVMKYFGANINDFIVWVNGLTPTLAKD